MNEVIGGRAASAAASADSVTDQRAARIAEQAAGDLVGAGHQLGGERLRDAGCDVLALGHHHHAVEDLPLDRAVGLVDDLEGAPAGGDASARSGRRPCRRW